VEQKVLPTGTPTDTPRPTPAPVSSYQPSAAAHYAFFIDLDYPGHLARVSETVKVTNNSSDTWDHLVFHVPISRVPGVFTLNQVKWLDSPAATPVYSVVKATLTYSITLAQPLPSGATVGLQIDYTLNVPRTSLNDWPPTGDLGYNGQVMQFGNWYPVLVPYRPGQGWYTWRFTEVGDPYVTEVAEYELEVRAPESLVVAGGGQIEGVPGVWRFHLNRGRVIGFSASPNYKVLRGQAGDIPVFAYYLAGHETAGAHVLAATVQSLTLFGQLYGPYPYASFTIAEDAFFGSMEYTGFVLHSGWGFANYEGRPDSMLIALTPHEVAHQWWYSLVGNDQVREPWLDESLAMYSELAFYRAAYPTLEDWFWQERVYRYNPAGSLSRSIYDFPDSQTYIHQLYRRGVLFFDDLRTAMGPDAFYAFLRDLRQGGENRLVTTDEFFKVLQRHGGSQYDGWIAKYFPSRAAPTPTRTPGAAATSTPSKSQRRRS